MSWQTHIPLAALRLDDFPFRHDCLANPSVLGRLIYRCRVGGKTTVCLFDSGANCSLISKEWVDKHNIPYHPSTQKVTLAQGNKTDTVVGTTAPLDFQLGAFDTQWPFLVLPHLSHNVILGTDFALWFRVTYDPYDWSLMILGNNQEQLPVFLQLPLCSKESHIEDNVPVADLASMSIDEDDAPTDTKCWLSIYPFLRPYEDLFFPILGNPPPRPVEHEIILKNTAKPKKLSPYPMSPEKRTAMHKQITDLLKQGALEPSYSPWASPLLFVKKKDNTWRMCVDFRNLNAETKSDAYPLPRMSTLLQKIGRAILFTKIDLASGFHQVPVKLSSREATAFSTSEPVQGHSHFQWKVMPFGLINAPATFQRLMESVLQGIPNCLVYIDDILIYTSTTESHRAIIKQVLDRLLQYKLYIKPEKCEFLKTSITFLGHRIAENTITLDDDKRKKIQGWESPLKSAKEVRQFWGLVSWASMYVPNLATIAAPLTTLNSAKRKFIWTKEAEEAMKTLQRSIQKAPALLLWEYGRPTRVTTDASDVGLGAVLEQQLQPNKWQPVEFWSRKLKPAETRYSATDKEWLAVVEAISTHWRHLLEGRPCIVRTDHKPLLGKLTKSTAIPPLLPRHTRWIERLSGFDLHLQHLAGPNNHIADALSRTPEFYASAITTKEAHQDLSTLLQQAAQEDAQYQSRIQDIQRNQAEGTDKYKDMSVRDGLIYRSQNIIEVPYDLSLRTLLLELNHDNPLAGHFGRDRTLDLLRRRWFWSGMATQVDKFVKSCNVCQRTKPSKPSLVIPQPIVPIRPWSVITLDFVGSFQPASETAHTECLVMVDKFTKMTHLAGCSKTIDAYGTAKLVLRHVIALHGIPTTIISDRGPQFDSRIWKDLWNIMGARVRLASPQYPQTDGQTERHIRTFSQLIRAYTCTQREQWEVFLPIFEFAMNNAYNTATGISPFFANYGRHPHTFDNLAAIPTPEETLTGQDLRRRLLRIWADVRNKLGDAANKIISQSRGKDSNTLHPGDLVHLERKRPLHKQEPLFTGPYPIKKRIGKATYTLEGTPGNIPEIQNIHRLRKFEATDKDFPNRTQRIALPEATGEYEIESILDHQGAGHNRRYLIKWKDSDDHTWLPASSLKSAQDLLQEYTQKILKATQKELPSVLNPSKLADPVTQPATNVPPPTSLCEPLDPKRTSQDRLILSSDAPHSPYGHDEVEVLIEEQE